MGRFYVTTPIFYVNDTPHIGHAYTAVTADAVARWHRLLGDDTFFLTGTDEHGLKIQRAAEAAGTTPEAHADRMSQAFRDAWEMLSVRPDDFIRTTEKRHHDAVALMLQRIHDNGHTYTDTYAGWYCVSCEAYYTEEELLPSGDGGPGICPDHGRPVEWLEEQNWFFRLSAFEGRLLEWLDGQPDAVIPATKRNEALGIIRQGLRDISISRSSISWGVPLPWDPDHVVYVWNDALINYATAVGYADDPDRFATWWPHVHHLIGKDILRFHCVYWPAMLLAAGEAPPAQIAVHGFLLVSGEKMSKTRLNQIAPAQLVSDFGTDGFRYHFLRDQPFGPDGDFSHEQMVVRYNADLANNLGNLLSRVTTIVARSCGGLGPAAPATCELAAVAAEVVSENLHHWEEIAPSQALAATWRLIRETNAFLESHEPWKLEPGAALDGVLGAALEVLRIVAVLASPAVPAASSAIWARIGLPGGPEDVVVPDGLAWGGYPGGLTVEKGSPLFPRFNP